ncbi:MAG: EamA family transporter [Acidimicrobiia bacterium]|nr:EamA family transporter [Acidimicrobiia bacterium]
MASRPAGLGAVPAPAFFVAGAVSQYVGAALAVVLFPYLGPLAVAWLRVGTSGALLWLLRGTPRRAAWDRPRRRAIAAFGVALAAMNLCFYLAVERLPLGNAVAIEFLGPIVVAVVGTRTARNVVALGLAVAGVVLLAEVQWSASPSGVMFALGSAVLWAGYIVLGARVARSGAGPADGLDALAWSMLIGSLAIAPAGLVGIALGEPTPVLVLGCAAVGVLSNVVPYGLDQVILHRLRPEQFALLLALLPATAAVVGAVALRQVPSVLESVGIGLVAAAVAARER